MRSWLTRPFPRMMNYTHTPNEAMKKTFLICCLLLASLSVKAQFTAVRINALGWATGTMNVGIDVAVSEKWSVDLSGYWNPIDGDNLRFKVLSTTIGVRRWRFEPHVGMFYGVHATVTKYKIGNAQKRYNGWMAGIGSSVGYSWMLSRRWNVSLEGGLGIFWMDDVLWHPYSTQTDDIIMKNYKRIVLAPSKIELSFSYLF